MYDGAATVTSTISSPYDLATDISGNVFVVNNNYYNIRKISSPGKWLSFFHDV